MLTVLVRQSDGHDVFVILDAATLTLSLMAEMFNHVPSVKDCPRITALEIGEYRP